MKYPNSYIIGSCHTDSILQGSSNLIRLQWFWIAKTWCWSFLRPFTKYHNCFYLLFITFVVYPLTSILGSSAYSISLLSTHTPNVIQGITLFFLGHPNIGSFRRTWTYIVPIIFCFKYLLRRIEMNIIAFEFRDHISQFFLKDCGLCYQMPLPGIKKWQRLFDHCL